MIVSSGSSDELKQKQENGMRESNSTSRVARQSKKEDKKKNKEKSARRIRCLSGSLIRSMTDPRAWVARKHNLSVVYVRDVMLKSAIAMSDTQVQSLDRKRTPKSSHRLQQQLRRLLYLIILNTNDGHYWVSINRLAKPTNKQATILVLVWYLKHSEQFPYTLLLCKKTFLVPIFKVKTYFKVMKNRNSLKKASPHTFCKHIILLVIPNQFHLETLFSPYLFICMQLYNITEIKQNYLFQMMYKTYLIISEGHSRLFVEGFIQRQNTRVSIVISVDLIRLSHQTTHQSSANRGSSDVNKLDPVQFRDWMSVSTE
ncbi:hypothetical protein EDC96DRAFT_545558 [Choanephora cucurbitarum]|nr:hypothetical protein EDC96DRAFT_545558 [Choanephora cucurbitarum]